MQLWLTWLDGLRTPELVRKQAYTTLTFYCMPRRREVVFYSWQDVGEVAELGGETSYDASCEQTEVKDVRDADPVCSEYACCLTC